MKLCPECKQPPILRYEFRDGDRLVWMECQYCKRRTADHVKEWEAIKEWEETT